MIIRCLYTLFCLCLMAASAQAAAMRSSPSKATELPSTLAAMQELAALPDGSWLGLDKRGLTLFDGLGQPRASLAIRGKQLDVRADAKQAMAVLLDADHAHATMIQIDLEKALFGAAQALPAQSFAVESLCLFRDQQQLHHLFVIGKDGQAEQWLLHGERPSQVRRLALPPQTEYCRVDDVQQRLLLAEPKVGIWSYAANSETAPQRQLLDLGKAGQHLSHAAGAFAVLDGALALLAEDGKTLYLLQEKNAGWQLLAKKAVKAQQFLAQHGQLYTRNEKDKHWRFAWQLPTLPKVLSEPNVVLQAQVQTTPMARLGDAADDPAIWVNPQQAGQSRVLATNKKQGLLVYDMQGKQLQLLEVGRLNNVDVRQNLIFAQHRADLAVASQRDENSLVLFDIAADGVVREVARFATNLEKNDRVCLAQAKDGGLSVFVNDKDGRYQQYGIGYQANRYQAQLLREFSLSSQPEGCVVDDVNQRLFLGEEKRGVWVMSSKPEAGSKMDMVLAVGKQLQADVEGMAIYYQQGQARYLIVSSQGDNSYVVLDAQAPYKVRGRFQIGFNLVAGIDGASETDGLDVTSQNLGSGFEKGMLVVQDGYKRLPDGAQNFKYVRWEDIAAALKLP